MEIDGATPVTDCPVGPLLRLLYTVDRLRTQIPGGGNRLLTEAHVWLEDVRRWRGLAIDGSGRTPYTVGELEAALHRVRSLDVPWVRQSHLQSELREQRRRGRAKTHVAPRPDQTAAEWRDEVRDCVQDILRNLAKGGVRR